MVVVSLVELASCHQTSLVMMLSMYVVLQQLHLPAARVSLPASYSPPR